MQGFDYNGDIGDTRKDANMIDNNNGPDMQAFSSLRAAIVYRMLTMVGDSQIGLEDAISKMIVWDEKFESNVKSL